MAGLDRDQQSETKNEQLRDVSISVKDKEKAAESTERWKTEEKQRNEGLTSETNPEKQEKKRMEDKITAGFTRNIGEIWDSNRDYEEGSEEGLTPEKSQILGEEPKREEYSLADMVKDYDIDTGDEVERREDVETIKTVKAILTDNTKTLDNHNTWIQEKGKDGKTLEEFKKSEHMLQLKQEIEEEERESKLVAGMSLHMEMLTVNQENVDEKGGNEERETRAEEGENIKNSNHNELVEREKEDHIVVSNLTPPLSTSSTQTGEEFVIPATIQIITQSQNPPSPPLPVHHNVPPSLLVTPTHVPPVSSHPPTPSAKVSPQFFPLSVTRHGPTTINLISVSTVAPSEVRSVLLLEDLLSEVLQSPGHHLKQNEPEVKASPNLEDVMVKNILFKPAQKELHSTKINIVVQPKEAEFIPMVQAGTPKPTEAKLITKDLKTKKPYSMPKSNENNPTAKPVQFTRKPNMTQTTGKPKTVKLMENDTKLTVKRNKASPAQPRLTKPSAKTPSTTARTPSTRPTKINRSSKNKTIKKSKEKKRKKDNKTQKKKVIVPTHFPYFEDNYCPPECACYGRVVQCSDKGVDKVPYGIPYNARYILLMNNQINSIQLDLLKEYISMEFLVLSNNQLTDGAIEGALEGIPALKRLYLDRNLLESVPTDIPASVEELRLDNNQLSVMSEAAWAQCPGLLVLSLSNNSLGNGSDSLPNAVLSPLSNLRTLNLDHNQLTSVPLGLPLSIKELYLKGNLIEQFRGRAFDGISELLLLDLSANKLTNKGLLKESLLNATHLESLNLEGNRLKQVPRYLPRSLKTLNLEGNLISSIKKASLGTLKSLEHLGLARNKIVKVAPGAFRTLPVLHQLDLCHNNLHQVPRQLPQALHLVALTHNKIQSVPRDAFCWGNKSLSGLVRVQLEHNLIDMGKLDAQAFRCLRGFQVVHFY
uniref:Wu:fc23c09 n=2 Tax=Dicentrarchus labrax TaxID=13489 RepID=A0A8C4IUS8_DICLA